MPLLLHLILHPLMALLLLLPGPSQGQEVYSVGPGGIHTLRGVCREEGEAKQVKRRGWYIGRGCRLCVVGCRQCLRC